MEEAKDSQKEPNQNKSVDNNSDTIVKKEAGKQVKKQTHIANAIQEIISDIDTNIKKEEIANQKNMEDTKSEHEKYEKAIEYKDAAGKVNIESSDAQNKYETVPKDELPHVALSKEEEKIASLRQQELELLKQHEELTLKIQEQQMLAQKLSAENQKLQEKQSEPISPIPKAPTAKEDSNRYLNSNIFSKNIEEQREMLSPNPAVERSENTSKQIDLDKIFTPAEDYTEPSSRNRKLYASSAFYSPQLHPTVEDQLELARKISSSLSDNCNETSKGQSMYVNRKKRSVKWVHEGSTQRSPQELELLEDGKENENISNENCKTKSILHLVMNPRGQIIDYNTNRGSLNTATGLLSPEKCAELTNALQTHKGKGAELFAKRRKKVDKWIIDEINASSQSPSDILDYQQQPPISQNQPNEIDPHLRTLNCFSPQASLKPRCNRTEVDANANFGMNSAVKYSPIIRDKTLNIDQKKQNDYRSSIDERFRKEIIPEYQPSSETRLNNYAVSSNEIKSSNPQRDLAYMPNIAKGWNAPSLTLPKELFVPKEIPLECYAPPPGKAMNESSFKQKNEINSYDYPFSSATKQKNYIPSPLAQQQLETFETLQEDNKVLTDSYAPFSYKQFVSGNTNRCQRSNHTKMISSSIQRPSVGHILKNCDFNNLPRGWNSPNATLGRAEFLSRPLYQAELPYTDF